MTDEAVRDTPRGGVAHAGGWRKVLSVAFRAVLAIHIPLGVAIFGLALLMLIVASIRPLVRSRAT
jgi:hypothetical protein